VITGIDHLAIAVSNPDEAIEELASVLGLPAGTSGGRHDAWGTRNRLLWLGDAYIELVTVFDATLAERSWLGRPTLRTLERGDAGAIGWAISTDDLDQDRAEMNGSGAALGPASAGERRRKDGQVVRWRLALPGAVDLGHPFLIEHDPSAAEWRPDDRAARALLPARLLSIDLPVDEIAGVPAIGGEQALGGQRVRRAGTAARVTTIRIGGVARPDAEVTVLGCRWRVE